MKKADLHMHTTYSDGSMTLKEVIQLAINANLDYISITDHDTLKGSIEAYNLQEIYEEIKFIIGFELSTESNDESVHILGYFKDSTNLDRLEDFLDDQRKQRVVRAHKIKDALLKHFNIDLNMDFADSLYSITRGSIANEIIKQGFPYSRKEIFDKMIGNGCPAYYPSTKLTTKHGIKLIHEYGGLAVLAHPCLLKKNNPEDIIKLGIDGIEAIYPMNKENDEIIFRGFAKKYNLFITAGNDFHTFHDGKHGNIGELVLTNNDLEIFLKKLDVI
jgi:predicted metal-dependent phosphoesterase TrpH